MNSSSENRRRSGWTLAWALVAVYFVFGFGYVILQGVYLSHRVKVGNPSDLSLNEVWIAFILAGWPIAALADSMDMSMRNAAVPVSWHGPIALALLIGYAAVTFLVCFLWARQPRPLVVPPPSPPARRAEL